MANKKFNAQLSHGVRGGGNVRSRGTPGYPIPDIIRPTGDNEDDNEDIVGMIENIVLEAIQGGALFTNTGGAQNARSGASAWSSAWNNMTDDDEEDRVNLSLKNLGTNKGQPTS